MVKVLGVFEMETSSQGYALDNCKAKNKDT